jgi:hypothetical protein
MRDEPPEVVQSKIRTRCESQCHRKVGSDSFRKIRVIVVPEVMVPRTEVVLRRTKGSAEIQNHFADNHRVEA